MQIVVSFAVGLVLGLGLIVSMMINPAKVLAFLDFAGAWDPSLALVMGSALVVTSIGYRLVLLRNQPVVSQDFRLPTKFVPDVRLVGGAALFGVGWGIAGLCPGPAIAALGAGHVEAVVFTVAMVVGMAGFHWVDQPSTATASSVDG